MTGEGVLNRLDRIALELNATDSGHARELRGVVRDLEELLMDEEVIGVA